MNVASPQKVIRIGQIEIRHHLKGADTHGALAFFEAVVPPNVRVPVSKHQTR